MKGLGTRERQKPEPCRQNVPAWDNRGMAQVLVVDDNRAVLEAFQILFELHEVPCKTAGSMAEALAEARGGGVGLVIQDMNQ